MRVLITGGAGFIGSHLAESLVADGHELTILDNFSTGNAASLEHLRAAPMRLVEGSILDEALLREAVADAECIYHLAAAVGVRYIIENPLQTITTNVEGTAALLRAAAAGKTPTLIVSTSEVYGKNAKAPLSEEDDSVTGPAHLSRWGYACTKALDEFLALAYHREQGLPVVIVRLFNTVGPRQTGRYGMVIPRFVSAALRGEALEVHGDGEQTRTFCDVEDAVRGMRALMAEPAANGEVFNLGGTEEVSIRALAERIIALTGSDSQIRLVPYEEAFASNFEDMRRRVPDISKAGRIAGYKPRYSLDQILGRIVEHKRRVEHAA